MGKIKKEPLSFFDEEQGFCSLADWEGIKPPPLPPQGSDFFYFCCQCETVINPEIVKEKGFCPNCKTASLKNFLCSFCQTILLNFTEEYEKRQVDLNEFCYCPLCKESIKKHPTKVHGCNYLMQFETERLYCPGCNQHLRHWVETKKTDNSKPTRKVQSHPSKLTDDSVISERFNTFEKKIEIIINDYFELKTFDKYIDVSIDKIRDSFTTIENKLNKLLELEATFIQIFDNFEKNSEQISNATKELEQQVSQDKNQIEVLQNKFEQLTENFVSNQSYTTSVLNKFRQELADFKTYLTPIANKPNEKPLVTNEIQNSSSNPPIIKYRREDDENERTIVTSRPLKQTQTNLDLSTVKGLVSGIHERFSDKTPLTKYPLTPNTLKTTSNTDEFWYYLVSLSNNNSKIHFAIPKNTQINSNSEFKYIVDFYSFKTTKLNGKLKIEDPAQIEWDEKIKGWKLVKKGEISIV